MYLKRLSLSGFRLFNRLDIQVPRRIILLVGNNAQGKTTILEALYFLSTFMSYQSAADRQMINFQKADDPIAVARIVADFEKEGQAHHLEVRIIQEPNGTGSMRSRKEVLLNNVKKPAQDSVGIFNAVMFLPQMMQILAGGPDERRRYLNLMASQGVQGHTRCLSEYNQAVSQRNALLKQLAERGGDPNQLEYWDSILVSRGTQLIQARIQLIQQLEQHASKLHQQLTRGQEVLRLVYAPSYEPAKPVHNQKGLPLLVDVDRSNLSSEEIASGFLANLRAIRRDEIARGVTLIGPHRDELKLLSNQLDLHDYGSRGQLRTALLSLKLAEMYWLKEMTGTWPVMLLDETLAELDQNRREDLLDLLSNCEQALLTTADLTQFHPDFVAKQTTWQVDQGEILSTMAE